MIEQHPLTPFLPEHAKVLMLGSFPPKKERWSMDFFYPNWINDMWRVVGAIFYNDRRHFELTECKRFDRERVVSFCAENGIALYDTARCVRRLRDNASDKFLEVVQPTDIELLLSRIPDCQAIVTTGQKATDTIAEQFACTTPAIGTYADIEIGSRAIRFWRMPSTSRAYPLAFDKKVEQYRKLFTFEKIAQ